MVVVALDMYEQVLVPTDGSEGSLEAVDHAVGVVNRCDAQLHTLHVVQAEGIADTLDEPQYEDVIGRLEHAGEEAVEAVRDRAAEAGVDDVDSATVRGVPGPEILDYVADNGIDLVVMATEGRTGSERELIGSVTEEVVRTASVPVLTINVG